LGLVGRLCYIEAVNNYTYYFEKNSVNTLRRHWKGVNTSVNRGANRSLIWGVQSVNRWYFESAIIFVNNEKWQYHKLSDIFLGKSEKTRKRSFDEFKTPFSLRI
jgi:hypothetical protein